MHLFGQSLLPENIPALMPGDFLKYLYAPHDIQGADNQFNQPQNWKEGIINNALAVVDGLIGYCHSIGDIESAGRIGHIDWHNRWSNNNGDIAADINFLYHIVSGENVSAHTDDRDRYDFLLSILSGATKKPLFAFQKQTIPGETLSEQSSLEELNQALRNAFIHESQREPYTRENLAKLGILSQ